MVSLQTIQQSNKRIASLPPGLVALFIGATSGIGLGALQHLAQHAPPSSRIYSVARPSAAVAHEALLASLRRSRPDGTYTLITADASLVSEIDEAVAAVTEKEEHHRETKLDILFLSAGFMAFEGRIDTSEGLDPSMSTRYYARLRAVQLLLPLLDRAPSPRVVSVLAGGLEAPLNEEDLDLRGPGAWSTWGSSVQAATMCTLALEVLARENPRLSAVHWLPGVVETPGLARLRTFGKEFANPKTQEEAGAVGLFLATSDRYAVPGGGSLVPVPEGLDVAERSGRGIFLVDPEGETADSEKVLVGMRERGVDKAVWEFTRKLFADCVGQAGSNKGGL